MLALAELAALFASEKDLELLSSFFHGAGFGTDAIARALGTDGEPHELVTNTAYSSLVYYDPELAESSAMAALGTLFVLDGWITRSAFERSVSDEAREVLRRRTLVEDIGDGYVRGTVSIVPHEDKLFFADRLLDRSPDGIVLTQSARDHIDPPNYSSLSLRGQALRLLPASGKRLLDIGSGTGFHGILLAPSFEQILGIDVTQRSLVFSQLNARLNGARIEHRECDVLALESPEPFEAIVFNSPTVPRYKAALDKIDTYDPPGGHLVLGFLKKKLAELLAPNGTCVIWTVFRVPTSCQSVLDLLREELGESHRLDLRVLVESRSPFRLGPEEIQRGRVPRGSFLLADPGDGPELLDFVNRSGTREIAPAVVLARHAAGSGEIQIDSFDPGLVPA